jgi:hypothetical protein
MGVLRGKALLVITREYGENVPFDVQTHIFTSSSKEYLPYEDFDLLDTDSLPLPSQAYKLEPGDRLWVNVSYEFHYTRGDGYTCDDDIELYYNRVRVIKRRILKHNRPENLMLMTTLLKKAFEFVQEFPGHEGSHQIEVAAVEAGKTICQYLKSLDVRKIGVLRDLIPEAFPKKLRKGELVVSQNIHDAWRVDPAPLLEMPPSWDPARRQDSGGFYG